MKNVFYIIVAFAFGCFFAGERSSKVCDIRVKIDETARLMSIGFDARSLYWSVNGGGPPPNPYDNPHASVSRWDERISAQHELPCWNGRFGYLAPDIAKYCYQDYSECIDKNVYILDPFSTEGLPFRFFQSHRVDYHHMIISVGPDKTLSIMQEDVMWSRSGLKLRSVDVLYDPTNGLESSGDMVITPDDNYGWYEPLTPWGKESFECMQ